MSSIHPGKKFDFATAMAMFGVALTLELARSVHYLFFHTMVEVFAVVVSLSIFILTWVSHRNLSSGYLIVLGAAYGAIGFVDVFHALTFKGMNLFPGVTLNYTNQFWLTARFLEAVALFCGPLMINRKPSIPYTSAVFFALAAAACLAVIYQWFPATFIEGQGLSPFKIYSEYVIITIMLAALLMLYRRKLQFEPRIYSLLAGSLTLAIAAEFCFTQYVGFYDFSHALGHYFRFTSVVLAFSAIVISGVRRPLDLLFREISDRRQQLEDLNAQLAESDEHLNRAQRIAKMGSWHFDIPENKLTWSDEIYRMFGEPRDKAISFEIFASHIHPEDAAVVFSTWEEALKGKPYDVEHRIVVGDTIRWVREVAELTFSEEGTPLLALGAVQDITERKQMEDQVRQLAFFDTLTQLPNRRMLSDRLNQTMACGKRGGFYSALMMLDLDNFKPLNDRYGHGAGDLLLTQVAERLKNCVREMDTVARFGGDEFVIVISELDREESLSSAQAHAIAEKIRSVLSEPYRINLNPQTVIEHRCTASIGAVVFHGHKQSQEEILKQADMAMYRAKEAGRDQIRVEHPQEFIARPQTLNDGG